MPEPTGTAAPQGNQGGAQPNSAIDWNLSVPTKVNGVEQMVTLRELANGYATQASMHEARTRANALEAELKRYQDTWDQLDADPAAFIERIKTTYKLTTEDSGSDGEVSQLAAELARMRSEMEKLAGNAATQQQISAQERQLAGLAGEPDFDRDKLLAYATAKGVDNLDHAWLMYKGEHGKPAEAPTPHQPHQDALDVLVSNKAKSLGMVNPGASAAPAAQHETPSGPPDSIAEALQGALGKHNMTMDSLMSSIQSGA